VNRKEQVAQAMILGNRDQSIKIAKRALLDGVSAEDILACLIQSIRKVGEGFEKFEIFLPELLMAADSMSAIMEIIEPRFQAKRSAKNKKPGKILLATVKGDTHEIGKNIVKTFFRANRFEVIDLGADVDSLEIVRTAEQERVDLIGLSALMTTTMPGQKEVIEILNAKGLRQKHKVIIGGCPTSQEWADKIGSDGWATDASSAFRLAERLLKSH
jgi:methylmalonyl-CoA mutase cobalamin-binding domain/chain